MKRAIALCGAASFLMAFLGGALAVNLVAPSSATAQSDEAQKVKGGAGPRHPWNPPLTYGGDVRRDARISHPPPAPDEAAPFALRSAHTIAPSGGELR